MYRALKLILIFLVRPRLAGKKVFCRAHAAVHLLLRLLHHNGQRFLQINRASAAIGARLCSKLQEGRTCEQSLAAALLALEAWRCSQHRLIGC